MNFYDTKQKGTGPTSYPGHDIMCVLYFRQRGLLEKDPTFSPLQFAKLFALIFFLQILNDRVRLGRD